ncbi:MAG: amino acid adenylation domain-containing protein [Jatrophihabitantaceae bacterium]
MNMWTEPDLRTGPQPPDSNQPGTLHDALDAQARATPDATALISGTSRLSYRELADRSSRLAAHLYERGVRRGDLVGLVAGRDVDTVVGMLAILKAGAGYVPLDPNYPAARLSFIIGDARLRWLVFTGAGLPPGVGFDGQSVAVDAGGSGPPPLPVTPADTAYVIYTSGSTGQPRGVVVSHAHVLRLFRATAERFQFRPSDVWSVFHSFSFDFSVWELWGALLHGGAAVLVDYDTSRSVDAFAELLRDHHVSMLSQTPFAFYSLAREVVAEAVELPALRWVVFGGEALQLGGLAEWLRRFGDDRPGLMNMYGITETTVHVTAQRVRATDRTAGIGRPLADLSVELQRTDGTAAAAGEPGEIVVAGAGVTLGYLNHPALTAARFLPDPGSPGGRRYRSGDVARWLPDGTLSYLGRRDRQVQLRGFRIEPGEVEAALRTHPAVIDAAVHLEPGDVADPRLLARVVVRTGASPAELRRHLADRLPAQLLPRQIRLVDSIALTPNGKVASPTPATGPSTKGTKMTDDEQADGREYLVVLNDEEQYSIWDAAKPVPQGWHTDGYRGSKAACLAHISDVWTDLRPRSLRVAMESDQSQQAAAHDR